jgi:hypothetical protein
MADSPIKRLVERRSPEVEASIDEWRFIRRSLEGGPGYVDGNLYRHPKEAPEVFEARKKRASDHHVNFTAQVRDTYLGYLFQAAPSPAPGLPDWATSFIDHGDMEGRPLVELAKDLAGWCLGYGIVWVAVDKPSAPLAASALTAAQEAELGLDPYAYLVHPTHVLDGRIERGRVRWLLVQEDRRDDVDPLTSTGKVDTVYRLWTETDWRLIAEVKTTDGGTDFRVVEEGVNPIGRVPFVPFRYGSGTGFASPGLLGDIAHLDRAIFNAASLKDEVLYTVTFPQLGIPYTGDLYEAAENGGFQLTPEGQGVLTMGLHSVIPFAAEAGAPVFVAPPNGPADTLSASIDKVSRQLLAMALLDGEVGLDGEARAASGVSKAYTFEKLNRRLAVIADRLESGFRAVLELVGAWLNRPADELPEGCLWDFPDAFEVRSLAQDVQEFAALMAVEIPSPTAKASMWLEILRKALPKVDPETWSAVEGEVMALLEASALGQIGPGMAAEVEDEDEDECEMCSGDGMPGGCPECDMEGEVEAEDDAQAEDEA